MRTVSLREELWSFACKHDPLNCQSGFLVGPPTEARAPTLALREYVIALARTNCPNTLFLEKWNND